MLFGLESSSYKRDCRKTVCILRLLKHNRVLYRVCKLATRKPLSDISADHGTIPRKSWRDSCPTNFSLVPLSLKTFFRFVGLQSTISQDVHAKMANSKDTRYLFTIYFSLNIDDSRILPHQRFFERSTHGADSNLCIAIFCFTGNLNTTFYLVMLESQSAMRRILLLAILFHRPL